MPNGEVITDQFEILEHVEQGRAPSPLYVSLIPGIINIKKKKSENTNLDNNIDLNSYLNFNNINKLKMMKLTQSKGF